jgi:hypothetical protein
MVASGAVAPSRTVKTAETKSARTVHVLNDRMVVATDAATFVSRWNDARSADQVPPGTRTAPKPGASYTGIFYVP